MQSVEFPSLYPCSTGHFCASGCCQSPIAFFEDSPSEIEEDFPLVWEHQRSESTALAVMHKKQNLPNAPTRLAKGKYTWDDDSSGRNTTSIGPNGRVVDKKLVTLPNLYDHYRECNERTMLTPYVSPQVYQKSGIPPSDLIANKADAEIHRKHVVRKIIKSPRGTRETKLVEENGKVSYFVNGVRQ